MIADKIKFLTGAGMMVIFAVLLVVMFSPVFDGKNALEFSDELYNSISKDSAYYIPDVKENAAEYVGTAVSVAIKMEEGEQAAPTALLYRNSGAEVTVSEDDLEISGDLGQILQTCLDDADSMYHNNGEAIREKYGHDERQALYTWWNSMELIKDALDDEGKFEESKIVGEAMEKAIEPAYNYYGINPDKITDRIGIVLFSLFFYVLYTIWYGFGLMFIFEGWGLNISHMFPFSFVARINAG
ncbi:MAG: hypothetical protein SVM79_06720 [Chloroflexota bacterium]|nr:hypothetical protein [Chloroflexota bacterium]